MNNARQNPPAIIVLSRIDTWWDLIENSVQTYLISVLEDLDAGLPLFLMATCSLEIPTMVSNESAYASQYGAQFKFINAFFAASRILLQQKLNCYKNRQPQ